MNRIALSAEGFDPPRWEKRLRVFARKALAALGRDGWELSVLLCDDRAMSELNLRFRGKEGPTDVLSFAQGEGFPTGGRRASACTGDVAISLDTLRENSRAFGVDPDEELRRLLIHGILHLDGMDHETNDEAEPMLRLQEKILEELADSRVLPRADALAGFSSRGEPPGGGNA